MDNYKTDLNIIRRGRSVRFSLREWHWLNNYIEAQAMGKGSSAPSLIPALENLQISKTNPDVGLFIPGYVTALSDAQETLWNY